MVDPTGIVKIVGTPIARFTFDEVKKRVDYVYNYADNVQRFNRLHGELKACYGDVKSMVEEEEIRSNREASESVKNWLKDAKEQLESESNKDLIIKEDERELDVEHQGCFGLCDTKNRHNFSRMAVKKAEYIEALLKKMNGCGLLTSLTRCTGVPDLGGINQGNFYAGLQSRKEVVMQIMDLLTKNNEVNRIGIFGMGGAGKTTIVEEIVTLLEKGKVFKKVLIVEISQFPNIIYIQQQIAERIGFSLDGVRSQKERAAQINSRLKRLMTTLRNKVEVDHGGKLLLILDNLWDQVDLRAFGISYELQNDLDCKIILTSRMKDVCRQMGVSNLNTYEVGDLSAMEAELLFKEMVGEVARKEEYKNLIEEVLTKCSRLPLSIKILANTLRNQNLDVWKQIIQRLEKSVSGEAEGVYYTTHSILELSYSYIRSKEQKMFFLLCCIFQDGESILFRCLLKYGIGLGLFQHMYSLGDAVHQARQWVDDLKSSSLLLEINHESGEIRIHDDVRDTGISIAAEGDQPFHVGACSWWLLEDTFKKYYAISMISSNSYEHLSGLHLPGLQLLRISKATQSKFDNSYFQRMQNIKILDLTGSSIESFPSLTESLSNLRTLLLDDCFYLTNITHACKLLKLDVLSLRRSNVEKLPQEISELRNLKMLYLTSCKKLKEIPAGVLAKLVHLEGLLMRDSFRHWQIEGNMASISELETLPLEILEIDVTSIKQLPNRDLGVPNLQIFGIRIGNAFKSFVVHDVLFSSRICIANAGACEIVTKGMNSLMNKAQNIYLKAINGLREFAVVSDGYKFDNLTTINVSSCDHMDYFIKENHIMESSYQHGYVHPESFPNLQEVTLYGLDQLQSYALPTQSARNLKVLKVSHCKRLQYIFFAHTTLKSDGTRCDDIELPPLQELVMENLPSFESFCDGIDDADDASQHLFSKKMKLSQLETLRLQRIPSIKHVWGEEIYGADCSMFNLKVLEIVGCSFMESVCPISVASNLQGLQRLYITLCEKMTQVITSKIGDENGSNDNETLRISNLSYVELSSLSSLTCFYRGSLKVEFPSLEKLRLEKLKKIESFIKYKYSNNSEHDEENAPAKILFSSKKVSVEHDEEDTPPKAFLKVSFPSLVELELHYLDYIEMLWDIETSEEFPCLTALSISDMPKLRHVLSAASERSSQLMGRLKSIEIRSCAMKSLIAPFQTPVQLHFPRVIAFSSLQRLILTGLTCKCLCQGNVNVKFPVLTELELKDLPLVELVKPEEGFNQTGEGTHVQHGKRIMVKAPLLSGEIEVPSLETLRIHCMYQLEGIFDTEDVEDPSALRCSLFLQAGLWNLTSLDIDSVTGLRHLFSTKSLAAVPKLEVLAVTYCSSLEQLFGTEEGHALALLPGLKRLSLTYLPKLENVPSWHMFPNLQSLEINSCFTRKKKRLIPAAIWVTTGPLLQKLKTLRIINCGGMEVIVGGDDDQEEEQVNVDDSESEVPAESAADLEGENESVILDDFKVNHSSSSSGTDFGSENESVISDDFEFHHSCFSTATDNTDVIEFPLLESVTLDDIDLLYTFSSARYDVHFPSLQSVSIRRCFNMRSFSSREVMIAPRVFIDIKIDDTDIQVNGGDLNCAVASQFNKREEELVSWPKTLIHRKHEQHILILTRQKHPKVCNVCTDFVKEVGFCCGQCSYYMCKICALGNQDELVQVPIELQVAENWPKSFKDELHDEHELKLDIGSPGRYTCKRCGQVVTDLFLYICKECSSYSIQAKCAFEGRRTLAKQSGHSEDGVCSTSMGGFFVPCPPQSYVDKIKLMSARASRTSTGGSFVPCSPRSVMATQKAIYQIPLATRDELNSAVLAAENAFPQWRDTSVTIRQNLMLKFQKLIQRDITKIASNIDNEQGKVWEDALSEVLGGLEHVCRMTTLHTKEMLSIGSREPLGVCAGICIPSLPSMIHLWICLSAIKFGNTFILKPSIKDAGACLLLGNLAMEAGFPCGVVNIIYGSDDVINDLCDNNHVRAISFVSSSMKDGMSLYRKASAKGKRVLWDIYSKNHAVVMPDANIDATLEDLIIAGFGGAGRGCMEICSVVFIGDDTTQWESRLVELARQLKVNDGFYLNIDIRPVTSKQEKEIICELVESGVKAGARILLDGRDIVVPGYEQGNFIGPTILSQVKTDMKCYKKGVPGPVLLCLRAGNLEEAIDIVNCNEFVSGVSFFTTSDDAARKFQAEVSTEQVGINVLNPIPLPFTNFMDKKESSITDVNSYDKVGLEFYTQLSATKETAWNV